jgi:hypothetical protein
MNQPYDMGTNTLMALLLRMGAMLIAVLILSITSCSMHADYRAAQAIEKGADPVAVACVFHSQGQASCALAAARRVE